MSVQHKAPFWSGSVNCGEAEGVWKDGGPLPLFPESSSVHSRCAASLNSAPEAELQDKNRGLFSQKDWGVSQSAVFAVPVVVAC